MAYGNNNRGGYQQRGGGGGYGGGNRQGGGGYQRGNSGGGQRPAPKDMSGSMRANDQKQSDKHPDLKGSIVIAGRKYWLSGWNNQTPDGDWIKLSATPADADNSRPQAAPQRGQAPSQDLDDDVPF